MRGEYLIYDQHGNLLHTVPNLITSVGIESYLKQIFQGDVTDVALAGSFYVGICGATVATTDTLVTLAGEPTVTNGYARNALARNATDWPTIAKVNGIWRCLSKSVTFTGSGGSFSAAWSRLFLCNAASGTSGILYSYSAALASPITVANGISYTVKYATYLNS